MSWLTFLPFRVMGEYIQFTPLADTWRRDSGGGWYADADPLRHPAPGHERHVVLGAGPAHRSAPGRHQPAGPDPAVQPGVQLRAVRYGGPSLFGGLSGVLYGLLGHCWIFQLLAPNPAYRLPRGVLVMMLVWLVLCLSGLVSMIGFGEIANAAHVGGLLIGCLTGLLGGLYNRRKTSIY
jgi:GlpG protein